MAVRVAPGITWARNPKDSTTLTVLLISAGVALAFITMSIAEGLTYLGEGPAVNLNAQRSFSKSVLRGGPGKPSSRRRRVLSCEFVTAGLNFDCNLGPTLPK